MVRRAVPIAVAAVVLAGCQGSPGSATWHDPPGRSPAPTIDLSKGRSQPVPDPLYPDYGNPALDVLHYDLHLAWSPEERELTGEATLTVRAVKRIDEIVLDFSAALRVEQASVDGRRVQARTSRHDLVLPLAEPIQPDATVKVTVGYAGRPAPVPMPSTRGDFDEGLGLRVESDGAVWTMQEPYGAFTWYPVNDQPSDEALYDIAVTVPSGWSGVASGQFLGSSRTAGGTRFAWRSAVPVGSYVTTLAVDRFARHTDRAGDVALTYWVPEEYDDHQLAAMRRSPEILEWLEERFGPYPFPALGAVAVDSESAMETQMMVTMGGRIAEDAGPEEAEAIWTEVLVHEYAHQWFGDAVSPRDWRGVWLNEGFATYIEMLWVIDEGDATQADYLRWMREADAESRAEAGPPGKYDPDMFAETNVYVGPALMLHEIREAIGDDKFFGLCREWVQRNLNTHQDRASFTRFVNDYTGRNFKPVIDKWLDSPTTPR